MTIQSAHRSAKSMCLAIAISFAGEVAIADPIGTLAATAKAAFAQMPQVRVVDQIAGECGADAAVNQQVAYCTTQNTIFINRDAAARPEAAYLVAHSYGHAVQVQHGVADVALREIRSRRDEEPKLRSYVASQVDCIAGFLLGRAGLPDPRLDDWFAAEPFTGTHWGRKPLSVGPQVAIGLDQRQAWVQRGYKSQDLNACAAGEFGAELLLRAFRG